MKLRTAVLTSVTGLMLSAGLADTASAQTIRYYRYPNGAVTRRYAASYDNRWEARQIVRQAYLDILRREPDASGWRQYTNAMLREGWSASDVRRSLANSDEYAQKFGRSRYWRYR
jgi:hypothetical protein